MSEASQDFALYEASVSEEGGVVKQKRLPDSMQNLAERIGKKACLFGPLTVIFRLECLMGNVQI